jgi:serpin B
VADEHGKNLFVSPSSVAVALAMTHNGAKEETRRAMAKALRINELSMDAVNQAARAWTQAVSAPAVKVEVAIANSIWVREGVPVLPEFTQRVEGSYQAKVAHLDFGRTEAANTINAWVKEKTRDKIKDIVKPPISSDTIMFLINALYFKGQWAAKFDAQQTRDAPFTLLDGTLVQVPMMSRTGDYEVKTSDGFQAVRLPYGDGRFSMYVFVPSKGSNVYSLAERFSPETWRDWTSGFQKREIPLRMPKFTIEYEVTLNGALKALGMEEAFDPARANFQGMVDPAWLGGRRAYINEVKHKTFVEVNEEGTEAAAVTSVGIAVTSAPPPFAVDRPFLAAIHDGATDTVLFFGLVVDPR